MKSRDYHLNEQTLLYINELGETLPEGSTFSTAELEELFRKSDYYHVIVDTFSEKAVMKAIGYAVTRSEYWYRIKRGLSQTKVGNQEKKEIAKVVLEERAIEKEFKGIGLNLPYREELIRFLAENLFDVLMLKKQIKDEGLRNYHFAKGVAEDLYFLTESFYKQKGLDSKKHSISDFITAKAESIVASGDIRSKLIYEHMVPKKLYLSVISKEALDGSLTYEMVYDLLDKYFYVCTIAKEGENGKLPATSMGEGWDGVDPFYRYERAGIEFYPNRFNQAYRFV